MLYNPVLLKQAKQEVLKIHPNEYLAASEDCSEKFHDFLTHLLGDKDIQSVKLSQRQMAKIASYLPGNRFNLDVEPLLELVKRRGKDSYLWKIIYLQWQNTYDQPACRQLMHKILKESEYFQDVILRAGFRVQDFSELIEKDAGDYNFSDIEIFNKWIHEHHIVKESRLYRDISRTFQNSTV